MPRASMLSLGDHHPPTGSGTSDRQEWVTERPHTRLVRVLTPLAVTLPFGRLIISHDDTFHWPLLFVLLWCAFCAEIVALFASRRVTLAVDSQGLTVKATLRRTRHFSWSEIKELELDPASAGRLDSAFLHLSERHQFAKPRALSLGGPAVVIFSSFESLEVSCSDPQAFFAAVGRFQPTVVPKDALVTADAGPYADPSTGSQTRDWTVQAVRMDQGRASLLYAGGIALIGAAWFGLLTLAPREVASRLSFLLWFLLAAVLLLVLRLRVWSSIRIRQSGAESGSLQIRVEPNSEYTIPLSAIQSLSIRRAKEFSWIRKMLGHAIPGKRAYFGGDALVVSTRFDTMEISVGDHAEAILEAVRHAVDEASGLQEGLSSVIES